MRNATLALATSLFISLVACSQSKDTPKPHAAEAAPTKQEIAARGQYLVGVAGCADCHTPKKFDPQVGGPVPMMERAMSGHPEGAPDPSGSPGATDSGVIGPTFTAFKLPFGVVYAANLTPDADTGIGRWTAEDFKRAMRTGKHRGADSGRPILPPMPWTNVQQASDVDLDAIYTYLESLPAVKNHVPEPNVPPPVIQAMAAANEKMASQKL